MNERSEMLLESMETFYNSKEHSNCLVDVLFNKRGGISLRKLEWFITNYAKKKNTSLKLSDGRNFFVHCAYKSTLDGYSKKLFDPFCRTQKIMFTIPNTNIVINTTVAQLNFIKWCIKNNIIKYLLNNYNTLEHKCDKDEEMASYGCEDDVQ